MMGVQCMSDQLVGDLDKLIGERVRALRQLQDRTLREVSQKLGCSEVHLSDLERGKRRWHTYRLADVAEALGVSPGLLQDPSVPIEKLVLISAVIQKLSPHTEERIEAFEKLLDTFPHE